MKPLRPGASHQAPSIDRLRADRELALKIVNGSDSSWREFVLSYSGLIQATARRHLHSGDEDDVRNVYAEVLSSLYRGGLSRYQGRCTLASWLILLTRNHTMDILRSRYGRRQVPNGVREMGEKERKIFKLYFEKGISFSEVRRHLAAEGTPVLREDLVDAIIRIDGEVDSRVLRRCSYDLQAQAVGVRCGRLLEFLDRMRLEAARKGRSLRPDTAFMEKEARERVRRVREAMASLPPMEQRILSLWFDQNRTAPQIAKELHLKGQRSVYTIIARSLRDLRRRLLGTEIGAE